MNIRFQLDRGAFLAVATVIWMVVSPASAQGKKVFLFGQVAKSALQSDLQDGPPTVVLMIDMSSSMRRHDCIDGDRNKKISRWKWCKNQLQAIARQTISTTSPRIKLVTFNEVSDVYPEVSLAEVAGLISTRHPEGETLTDEILKQQFKEYFALKSEGKLRGPLLINILTDGRPKSQARLRRVIIEATQKLDSPDEIAINILHVGKNQDSMAAINRLDCNLMGEGAKFDIVRSRDFSSLQRLGLSASIIDDFTVY